MQRVLGIVAVQQCQSAFFGDICAQLYCITVGVHEVQNLIDVFGVTSEAVHL